MNDIRVNPWVNLNGYRIYIELGNNGNEGWDFMCVCVEKHTQREN